ncbi:hypothetical protein J6590_010863 [Homalodisca vitripennis]|nr:hypothetical protein J6590_010863 [Homalodisca vitripennis]
MKNTPGDLNNCIEPIETRVTIPRETDICCVFLPAGSFCGSVMVGLGWRQVGRRSLRNPYARVARSLQAAVVEKCHRGCFFPLVFYICRLLGPLSISLSGMKEAPQMFAESRLPTVASLRHGGGAGRRGAADRRGAVRGGGRLGTRYQGQGARSARVAGHRPYMRAILSTPQFPFSTSFLSGDFQWLRRGCRVGIPRSSLRRTMLGCVVSRPPRVRAPPPRSSDATYAELEVTVIVSGSVTGSVG